MIKLCFPQEPGSDAAAGPPPTPKVWITHTLCLCFMYKPVNISESKHIGCKAQAAGLFGVLQLMCFLV